MTSPATVPVAEHVAAFEELGRPGAAQPQTQHPLVSYHQTPRTHGPSRSSSLRNRREATGPCDEKRFSPRAASQRPCTPRERMQRGADAPHLSLSDDLPAVTSAAGEIAELRDQ
eukprot:37871-Pyramimonas_sp.AAC.1